MSEKESKQMKNVLSQVEDFLKKFIKKTPLKVPAEFLYTKFSQNRKIFSSQTDESSKIEALIEKYDIPMSFIEFGFSTYEFNCAKLLDRFEGLLVDGNIETIAAAKKVYPSRVRAQHAWLNLENLGFIAEYANSRKLGILSIEKMER